ncbi:unnamed protein product [Leptosia nina]|uniref:Carboxylic ester hydrolase n=1 Tax=Leptosia nina TaxID=320188 RepID=A0AAV1IS97_9NEOP
MLIIFLFYSVNVVFSQDPVANLIQGRVVGIKVFQESSLTPIEIYFGIPYAAPPTGRLRFSPPERHSGWKRTYFAHRVAPSCPQHNQTENDSSENCLYLNIWTSRRVDGRPQPVIVILYSESWTGGALNLPCQELASEGVVVVTVSYRLHFLSFFTLKSAKARGNLALLDQYLALLWVHENISAFGGDPSSVTLLGHSAGADSVLHHIISPRATGLFHKAIIMSPHNTWQGISGDKTVTADEIARVSREVAQSVGCLNYTSRDEDVLYCMQNKPLKDFTISFTNKTLEKYMQPISDDFLPESIQYLPLSIVKVLKNPTNFYVPIDIMLGTTDLDSVKPLDSRFKSLITKSYKQIYDFSLEKIIPDILHALSLNNPETLQTLVNAVVWEYWDPERDALTSYKAVTSLAAMDTAVNSAVGSYYLAEKLSNHVSKTFVYRYSQPTKVDLQGNRLNFTGE